MVAAASWILQRLPVNLYRDAAAEGDGALRRHQPKCNAGNSGDQTVSGVDRLENSGAHPEFASSRKGEHRKFITKFARGVYTPIVVGAAVFGGSAATAFPRLEHTFGDWLYRALIFLVISCPCALVVSIPLGGFSAGGGASSVGILVKAATTWSASFG